MPEWSLPQELDFSGNAFRDKFGHLSVDEWCDLLVLSLTSPIIDGIEFPHFAPQETQDAHHGSSGEIALREAAGFYKFISSKPFFREKAIPGAAFLDFGTGWGRIARFFLRDFDLRRFFAFEPKHTGCFRARTLNPYLCVLTGDEIPDQSLPPNWFDLIVGWSIFSHLSEYSTTAWLEEMARIMRPGGYCVFTTFGDRFLDQLIASQSDLSAGKDVHWYSRSCLEAAGDIADLKNRYLRGEFVWLGGGLTKYYGYATFLHDKALLNILRARRLPMELIDFDRESLGMDTFILRRK
jgi:SAM-dependent methyltransferase